MELKQTVPENEVEDIKMRPFLSLLQTGKYADHTLTVQGKEIKVHKAILYARCPQLLKTTVIDDFSPSICLDLLHYIYTNRITPQTPLQLLQLLRFSAKISFTELHQNCRFFLLNSINSEKVFDIMVECSKWSLQEELDWCVWFVGKNKISLSPEFISEIRDNPALISKIFAEAVKLTIPQPKILPISPKDFDAALGNLFSKKKFCDFTIVVRNVGVEVHTCVLASKWMFFSRILCREKNSVEHETPMPIETFQKLIKYFLHRRSFRI